MEYILIIWETNDRLPYSLLIVFMHSANRNLQNINHLLVSALSLPDRGLEKHKTGHKICRATENHSYF